MIVGRSAAMERAAGLAERYASTSLPILLVGETGTGKEVFAQHIHELSGRRGPLVDVNCCALPREMVESLLFGHSRGAFTGAVASVQGYVRRSHAGTLFLDELDSLGTEAQGKLLRVLETQTVEPLGGDKKQRLDLRVVGAAATDLELCARTFRTDLYQRLAGVVIHLPSLRHRLEDVIPLAEHFARQQGRRLDAGADRVLLSYEWPGNVRELRQVIERAGRLVQNGTLPAAELAEAIDLGHVRPRSRGASVSSASSTDDVLEQCRIHGWNVSAAARSLHISRATLYRRLATQGISAPVLRNRNGPAVVA